MNKNNCPKIKVTYAIMVETKKSHCWVTYANGSTIGTEKGAALLTDEENADYIALRLFSNGVLAYTAKIPDGVYPSNNKEVPLKDYKWWAN